MEVVLLMYQCQLFGTAFQTISEISHYALIRLGAISKPTFLHVINLQAMPYHSVD